jgi:hypothetical protein
MTWFSLQDITSELHAIIFWYLNLKLKEIKYLRKLRIEKCPNLYCCPNGWETRQSCRRSDQSTGWMNVEMWCDFLLGQIIYVTRKHSDAL